MPTRRAQQGNVRANLRRRSGAADAAETHYRQKLSPARDSATGRTRRAIAPAADAPGPATEGDDQVGEEKDAAVSAQEKEDAQMAEMLTIMWAVTADDSRGKTLHGEWLRADGDALRVFLDTAENLGATAGALNKFLGTFTPVVRWRIAHDTHRSMSVKLAKALAADPTPAGTCWKI